MTIKEILTQSLEKAFKDAGKIENPTERVSAYNAIADNCAKVLGYTTVVLDNAEVLTPDQVEDTTEPATKPAAATAPKSKSTTKSKAAAAEPTTKAEAVKNVQTAAKAVAKTAPELPATNNTAVNGTVKEPTTDTESTDPNSFTEEWNEAAFTYFENELSYIQEIANQFVSSGNRPALIAMLEAATDGQVHDSDGITPLNVRLIYDYLNAQVQAKQG